MITTVPYHQLRLRKRMDLAAAIPMQRPLTIYIEPTNKCNFRCTCCPHSFDDYAESVNGLFSMPLEDFKHIVQQIEDWGGVETINFYMMGEPLANKNLWEMVHLASREEVTRRTIVTTNASMLTPDKYEAVVASKLTYLRVSIFGPNEDAHKTRSQSRVPLQKIIDNVRGLKDFRDSKQCSLPLIYVKMIEMSKAENQEFYERFPGVGDEMAIEPIMNWNDSEKGNLAGFEHDALVQRPYFTAHGGGHKEVCPFPFYTMLIHSDMNVSICGTEWSKKTIVGNARTQTLQEIWHGDKLRDVQLKMLQRRRSEIPGCATCTYLHTSPDNIDRLGPGVLA